MTLSKAKAFSNRLADLMSKRGYTGADLVLEASRAAGTKVGRHRITLLLSGDTLPTATEAAALATVLGSTVEHLIGDVAVLPEPARRRYTATSGGESRERSSSHATSTTPSTHADGSSLIFNRKLIAMRLHPCQSGSI